MIQFGNSIDGNRNPWEIDLGLDVYKVLVDKLLASCACVTTEKYYMT